MEIVTAQCTSELIYSFELSRKLNALREEESFCDVTLVVSGGEFRAHKTVLAASSPYFSSLFANTDRRKKIVNIEVLQASVMEDVLTYLYTGRVKISESNVQELVASASYLDIAELKESGSKFLEERLCIYNSLSSFTLAEASNLPELKEASRDMILKNFSLVSKTEEFLRLSAAQLESWLSNDSLENIKSEREVYAEALLRWYNFDEKNRGADFSKLFEHIPLASLPSVFLSTNVLQEEVVKKKINAQQCIDLVVKAAKRQTMVSDGHLPLKKPRKCLQTHADCIVVTGGFKESGERITSTKCFVPYENKWYDVSPMTTARTAHGMVTCQGFIFAIGSSSGPDVASVERYDPRINSWASVAPLSHRSLLGGIASLNGFLYVIGGKEDGCKCVNASVQRYNPTTNMWQLIAPLNVPRFSICTVADGDFLYAIGGADSTEWTKTVERYDSGSDTWEEITSMNERKFCPIGTLAHDKIFIVGSSRHNNSEITCSNNCEVYDPPTEQWQCIASTDVLSFTKIAWADGKLFLCGGYDGNDQTQRRKVKSYSLVDDRWVDELQLPFDVTMFGCCTAQIPRNALVQEIK